MTLKSNPEALDTFTRILFRSSAYSIAAYVVSRTLEGLLMMAGAAIYGYSVSIDYREIGVVADPTAWNQESVMIIYLFPYLIQAIILVLLYINLERWHVKFGYTMVFTHWVMFFIAFRLAGMLPVHIFCKTGIYHAFNWLYLGLAFKIIISFTGIVLFLVAGTWFLKGILFFFATYNDNVKVTGLQNLIYSALLFPSLIGCMIPLLFYLPLLPKDEIIGILVIAMVSTYTILRLLYGRHELFPKGEIVKEKFHPLGLFLIVLLMMIILRIVLGIGLNFW
jgi:hypothetical protein